MIQDILLLLPKNNDFEEIPHLVDKQSFLFYKIFCITKRDSFDLMANATDLK